MKIRHRGENFLARVFVFWSMFVILILNGVLVPLTAAELSSDYYTLTLLDEKMPLGLAYGSGSWNGKYAYVFGGWDNLHNSGVIVKFDPNASEATALLDNLPSPRWGTAAVYANGTAYGFYGVHNVCYIFGGFSGVGSYDSSTEIVRFWPDSEWRDLWRQGIPGRGFTSAVWDGNAAYLFGGIEAPGESIPSAFLDEILKFDPNKAGDLSVEILPEKLPSARAHASAVWGGNVAYIFGGGFINETNGFEYLDDIVKFDPSTGEVTRMKAKLPSGRAYTSAIWNGTNAYVFGGQTRLTNGSVITLDEVVRYDPSTDEASILQEKLPSPREGTVAVWTGVAAYIFGGRDGSATDRQIIMMSHELTASTASFSGLEVGILVTVIAAGILIFIYGLKKARNRRRS